MNMPSFRTPKGMYFAGGLDAERKLQLTPGNATCDVSYRECGALLTRVLERQLHSNNGHFLFKVSAIM
jgi:hypothetical protein